MKKGKITLGTHDGRTIITDKKEINTGDSLLITVPEQKINEIVKLEEGNSAYLTAGKYVGEKGVVSEIKGNVAKIKIGNREIETKKSYVFITGKDKPVIEI